MARKLTGEGGGGGGGGGDGMRSAVFLVQLLSIDSRRLSCRVIPVSFCWTTLCVVAYGTGRPEPKCSLERLVLSTTFSGTRRGSQRPH